MNIKIKRVLIVTFLLLLIPLITMQFTEEVDWKAMDFLLAGLIIFITGSLIQIILIKVKKRLPRIALILFIIVCFLLIWAELAVGLLGTLI